MFFSNFCCVETQNWRSFVREPKNMENKFSAFTEKIKDINFGSCTDWNFTVWLSYKGHLKELFLSKSSKWSWSLLTKCSEKTFVQNFHNIRKSEHSFYATWNTCQRTRNIKVLLCEYCIFSSNTSNKIHSWKFNPNSGGPQACSLVLGFKTLFW